MDFKKLSNSEFNEYCKKHYKDLKKIFSEVVMYDDKEKFNCMVDAYRPYELNKDKSLFCENEIYKNNFYVIRKLYDKENFIRFENLNNILFMCCYILDITTRENLIDYLHSKFTLDINRHFTDYLLMNSIYHKDYSLLGFLMAKFGLSKDRILKLYNNYKYNSVPFNEFFNEANKLKEKYLLDFNIKLNKNPNLLCDYLNTSSKYKID